MRTYNGLYGTDADYAHQKDTNDFEQIRKSVKKRIKMQLGSSAPNWQINEEVEKEMAKLKTKKPQQMGTVQTRYTNSHHDTKYATQYNQFRGVTATSIPKKDLASKRPCAFEMNHIRTPEYSNCSHCNIRVKSRKLTGSECEVCWNRFTNFKKGSDAEKSYLAASSKQATKKAETTKQEAIQRRAEQEEAWRIESATASLQSRYMSKCTKCQSIVCKEECGDERHMRHAALHAIQSYLAVRNGGTYCLDTGLNRAFGYGFVNCTYSDDGFCRCLMPVTGSPHEGSNGIYQLQEPELSIDNDHEKYSEMQKLFSTANPSLVLTALAICERLLHGLAYGFPAKSDDHPLVAYLRALEPGYQICKHCLSDSSKEDQETIQPLVKQARKALASLTGTAYSQEILDNWDTKTRGQVGQWCAISETMGDVLIVLVMSIWMYIDGPTLVTSVENSFKRNGFIGPITITKRLTGLRVLRDFLLLRRVTRSMEKTHGKWRNWNRMLANAVLQEFGGHASVTDNHVALSLTLRKMGIRKEDFSRLCLLAHGDRLRLLFKGKPGKDFIDEDAYNKLEAATMVQVQDALDQIVEQVIPSELEKLNAQDPQVLKLGSAPRHFTVSRYGLALASYLTSNDTAANANATIELYVGPRKDVWGGTSLNYITFLFGHESMEKASIAKTDFGVASSTDAGTIYRSGNRDHAGDETSAGFNTASSWVTQVGFLRALANYGNALFTAAGRKQFSKQSNWQIGTGIARNILTGWQALSGPLCSKSALDAAPHISTGCGLAGVGAGFLKNVIDTADAGRTLHHTRTRNKNLKKRLEKICSEEELVKAFASAANTNDKVGLQARINGQLHRGNYQRPGERRKAPLAVRKAHRMFNEGLSLQGAKLVSSIVGVCSSAFTLSVGIAAAANGASLAAVLATGAGVGAAVPIVGWGVMAAGIALSIGVATYEFAQEKMANNAMKKYGLLIDAKDMDDAKVAQACLLIYTACLLDANHLEDEILAATVYGLQALVYLLFSDFVVGEKNKHLAIEQKWKLVKLFAAGAGPEGLFDAWRAICPNLRKNLLKG